MDKRAELRRALARAGAEPTVGAPLAPSTSSNSPAVDRPMLPAAPADRVDHGDLNDFDLAVLAGDGQRAVTVALFALRHMGAIECGDELVRRLGQAGALDLERLKRETPASLTTFSNLRAVGPPAEFAHPLEQAVYDVIVATGAYNGNLTAIRAATAHLPALAAIDARLAGLGLVRPEPERGPLQRRRTRLGSKVVRSERDGHERPRPWRAGTSGAPSFAVRHLLALYGDQCLWDADPALALALDLDHPVEWTGSGNECGGCE